MNISDAIKYAIKWEKQAQEDYLKWSQAIDEPEVKKFFKNLSDMENGHIRVLEKLNVKKDFEVNVVKIPFISITSGLSSFGSESDIFLKKVFEFAMKKEDEAVDRYQKIADKIDEMDLKKIFLRLVEEEKTHKIQLRDSYHKLFNPA